MRITKLRRTNVGTRRALSDDWGEASITLDNLCGLAIA